MYPTVKLKGQEFQGLLDFKALSLIQYTMKKKYDMDLGMSEIFIEIDKQNLLVMLETVITSIQRVHTQIPREHIESKIGLRDSQLIYNFIDKMLEYSLPNEQTQEESVEG